MSDRFLIIYNCYGECVSREYVNIDTIKHVFLRLPDRKEVTVEYINPSTGRCSSMTEYYRNVIDAEMRMTAIGEALNAKGKAYMGYPVVSKGEENNDGT